MNGQSNYCGVCRVAAGLLRLIAAVLSRLWAGERGSRRASCRCAVHTHACVGWHMLVINTDADTFPSRLSYFKCWLYFYEPDILTEYFPVSVVSGAVLWTWTRSTCRTCDSQQRSGCVCSSLMDNSAHGEPFVGQVHKLYVSLFVAFILHPPSRFTSRAGDGALMLRFLRVLVFNNINFWFTFSTVFSLYSTFLLFRSRLFPDKYL